MSRTYCITRFAAIAFALTLGGCSHNGTHSGIRGFGDTVLTTTGYTPSPEGFDVQGILANTPAGQSPEQEYYLGRAVAAHILMKYDLLDNAKALRYLNELLQAIVAQSELPDTFGGYHVTILDTDEINAVSVPGGLIFVSRGMLRTVHDEDTLAAVLAHEVTHVGHHHGIRSLDRGSILKKLEKYPIPLGLNCDEVLLQAAFALTAIVDDLMDKLFESGYSHEFEFDADKGAVKLLRRTGFKPAAIIAVLATLQQTKNRSSGWFSTHPSPEERIEAAEQVLSFEGTDDFFKSGMEERNRRFNEAMKTLVTVY